MMGRKFIPKPALLLPLTLLASKALVETPRADALVGSTGHDLVFDANLSTALQEALERTARDQGVQNISASLHISDRCRWEGTTGATGQDPSAPVESDMLYSFASITKTLVAAIIFQLVEENKLALQDELRDWLDDYPNVNPSITVHQLLNHTSGLGGYIGKKRFRSAIKADPEKLWSPEDVLKFILPPSTPPGEGMQYSNTNYILLGLIIEAATGNSVEQELEQRIFKPLGLKTAILQRGKLADQRWANSTAPSSAMYSAMWTAGALVSAPRDVAKWGHVFLSGRFLRASSMKQMLVFANKKIGRHHVPMGLGVWNFSRGDIVAWGHGGRLKPFLSRMFYLPDYNLSVAYAFSGGHGQGAPGKHLVRAYLAHRPSDISACFRSSDQSSP